MARVAGEIERAQLSLILDRNNTRARKGYVDPLDRADLSRVLNEMSMDTQTLLIAFGCEFVKS